MGTTAYGFLVAARWDDLRRAEVFLRVKDGSITQTVTNGLTIASRRYASTPESVAEEQPLVTKNLIVVYEGRVDNREEIARVLGRPQVAYLADGAVLAVAYEAWGRKLSAMVIGEYSYVVFDRHERHFVAGQDSLGVRRIYYRVAGEHVWITSNLSLLFERCPEARSTFDREALPEYFAGTMSPWSGRTIWKGIRELGDGQVLVQRGDTLERSKPYGNQGLVREPTSALRTLMKRFDSCCSRPCVGHFVHQGLCFATYPAVTILRPFARSRQR